MRGGERREHSRYRLLSRTATAVPDPGQDVLPGKARARMPAGALLARRMRVSACLASATYVAHARRQDGGSLVYATPTWGSASNTARSSPGTGISRRRTSNSNATSTVSPRRSPARARSACGIGTRRAPSPRDAVARNWCRAMVPRTGFRPGPQRRASSGGMIRNVHAVYGGFLPETKVARKRCMRIRRLTARSRRRSDARGNGVAHGAGRAVHGPQELDQRVGKIVGARVPLRGRF